MNKDHEQRFCKYCESDYTPTGNNQDYCSKICGALYNHSDELKYAKNGIYKALKVTHPHLVKIESLISEILELRLKAGRKSH